MNQVKARPEHAPGLKIADFELAVFDNACNFRATEFKGRGTRDSRGFASLEEAIEFCRSRPRSVTYAVAASGRSMVIDRDKWDFFLARKNSSITKGTMSMSKVKSNSTDTSSIYDEILETILLHDPDFKTQYKKEPDQDYLKRICKAINELPDRLWNQLSEERAQAWYNDAADSIKADEDIALPDGYAPMGVNQPPPPKAIEAIAERKRKKAEAVTQVQDEPESESEGEPDEGETEGEPDEDEPEEVAPPAKKRGRPAKSKEDKVAKPPREPKKPGISRRGNGVVSIIRKFLIEKPDATNEDIKELLNTKGMVASNGTISATKQFTLQVLDDVKAAGHWQ